MQSIARARETGRAPVRTLCAAAALGVLVMLAPLPLAAQRAAPRAAEQSATFDAGRLADAIVATIERRFFDEDRMRVIGWSARAEAAKTAARAAGTPAEAVGVLRALLAALETSHTALFTPDDIEYYILADVVGGREAIRELWAAPSVVAGTGFFAVTIEGRSFVDAVLEGSPADKAGLRPGDEVVSVDGAPFTPVAAFRGKAGQIATIAVRSRRDGPVREVAVPVVLMQPSLAFAEATRNSARVIERAGRRIGYVHLWSVRESEELGRAIARIDPSRPFAPLDGGRGAGGGGRGMRDGAGGPPLDALIVDNRVKVGGSPGVVRHWLHALDDRDGVLAGRSRERGRDWVPRASFRGRVAMLIDHRTRSAAELFAHAFRRDRLGPLIGTRTAGAVSAGSVEVMPGGLLLYVAVTGLRVDGTTLERSGVSPDITVERMLPYSEGADPVLEAAIAHLLSTPTPAKSD